MKGVRFWGTRGSLPVALTARDVKEKLLGALRAARGRPLASESDLASILDGLPFAAAGTYGGHSSCVQLDSGGPEFFVCDMGSGLRPFGQAATAASATWRVAICKCIRPRKAVDPARERPKSV